MFFSLSQRLPGELGLLPDLEQIFAEKNWLSTLPKELAMCRSGLANGGILHAANSSPFDALVGSAANYNRVVFGRMCGTSRAQTSPRLRQVRRPLEAVDYITVSAVPRSTRFRGTLCKQASLPRCSTEYGTLHSTGTVYAGAATKSSQFTPPPPAYLMYRPSTTAPTFLLCQEPPRVAAGWEPALEAPGLRARASGLGGA